MAQSDVARIDAAAFERALSQSSLLARRLLGVLAARLLAATEHHEEVLRDEVASRLARKLLLLAARFGGKADGGVAVSLRLSQQDLADLADTSRQTVNKLLRGWGRQGWVGRHDGRLVIHDLAALRALCATKLA
jgi:CRP-like cAMP-binding protein